MEKGSTKQKILEAALDLFSIQGFEATSISQIASAVGIQKASLYSHFASKQAILDSIKKEILEQYEKHSIFSRMDQENDADQKNNQNFTIHLVTQMIQDQIYYILHDPHISKARKMLTIEQFQNQQLAELQTKQNYTDVMHCFTGLMNHMIQQGVLKEDDPEIMAAQLCLPITTWINLCDRHPDLETEIMKLVARHIQQFFRIYQP